MALTTDYFSNYAFNYCQIQIIPTFCIPSFVCLNYDTFDSSLNITLWHFWLSKKLVLGVSDISVSCAIRQQGALW